MDPNKMPVRVLIPICVLAFPLLVMGICMFWYQHIHDMIADMEKNMDVLNAHKYKARTSIVRFGTMVSVINFSSLCINMDLIITAITTADSPPPKLHQFWWSSSGSSTAKSGHGGTMQLTPTCHFSLALLFLPWEGLQSYHQLCHQFCQRESCIREPTHFWAKHLTFDSRHHHNESIWRQHHSSPLPWDAHCYHGFLHWSIHFEPLEQDKSCTNAHPDLPHQTNIPGPKPVTSNGNMVPHTFAEDKRNTTTPVRR